MLIGLLVMMIFFFMLVHVRITFYVAYISQFLWAADVQIGAIHLPEINPKRLEQFRLRRPSRPDPAAWKTLLSSWRHTSSVRRYLRSHIHLEALEGTLTLSLTDAAKTALLTGILSSLGQLVTKPREQVTICILPDFTGSSTSGKAKGIISFRLGTLLVSSILLLMSRRRQRRAAEDNMKEA